MRGVERRALHGREACTRVKPDADRSRRTDTLHEIRFTTFHRPACRRAAVSVFCISMATVIGPTPPRHRRDERGALARRRELDVADQAPVGDAVDADVDHDTARADPFAADHLGASDGGDQHVGAADLARPGRGARVADGQRRVPLEQHEGDRLADQIAAARDDGARALQLHAGRVDEMHDAERRARTQAVASLHQARLVDGMQPVDVLRLDRWRRSRRQHRCARGSGSCTRMPWTSRRSFSERTTRKQLVLRRLGGQLDALREDAHFGARLALAAHVAGRGRIVADQHGRQSGCEAVAALKRRHLLLAPSPRSAFAAALPSMISPMRRPYSMHCGL